MDSRPKAADILMVGKTGNGKSALGNMILQKPKAFHSRNQLESVTQEIQFDYSRFEDTEIKIVDGPGVGDTMKDKEKAINLVVEAMHKAVMTSVEGFHAILIVVRYGGRFTDEDVKTLNTLKKIFGESFITDHSILVMTCGDLFKIDAEENDNETFEQWCQRQGGIFSELLKEVNNRVILFNNKATGDDRVKQIRRLLQMIEGLSGTGARYTSKIFSDAKLSRDRLVVESKSPLLQENTIREAGIITYELGLVDDTNPEEELGRLNLLKTRAGKLLQSVIEQDKGTKALTVAIDVADSLVKTLTGQIEQLNESIRLKAKEEELQRKMKEEEEKAALEEKRREEQRQEDERRRKEEEEKRKEEEEKRRQEEEEKRKKEERQRREYDEERERQLQEIKDEQERLAEIELDNRRKEQERQEALKRDAERREEEKRREEQLRIEEEKRKEEWRRQDVERQKEKERLEKEARKLQEKREAELKKTESDRKKMQQDIEQKKREAQADIDKKYKQMKKEQSKPWYEKVIDWIAARFS